MFIWILQRMGAWTTLKVNSKEEYEYIKSNINIEPQIEEVTKQEFIDFCNSYPRPLTRDVCGISEPPAVSYNDFEIGWWPLSIVASTHLYDDNPEDYFYVPEEERFYSIVTNYTELYEEAQTLLKKYKDEKFHKQLKDKFIASGKDNYTEFLENQCLKYEDVLLENKKIQDSQKASRKLMKDVGMFIFKQKIKALEEKMQSPDISRIREINAYKDSLKIFEDVFWRDEKNKDMATWEQSCEREEQNISRIAHAMAEQWGGYIERLNKDF